MAIFLKVSVPLAVFFKAVSVLAQQAPAMSPGQAPGTPAVAPKPSFMAEKADIYTVPNGCFSDALLSSNPGGTHSISSGRTFKPCDSVIIRGVAFGDQKHDVSLHLDRVYHRNVPVETLPSGETRIHHTLQRYTDEINDYLKASSGKFDNSQVFYTPDDHEDEHGRYYVTITSFEASESGRRVREDGQIQGCLLIHRVYELKLPSGKSSLEEHTDWDSAMGVCENGAQPAVFLVHLTVKEGSGENPLVPNADGFKNGSTPAHVNPPPPITTGPLGASIQIAFGGQADNVNGHWGPFYDTLNVNYTNNFIKYRKDPQSGALIPEYFSMGATTGNAFSGDLDPRPMFNNWQASTTLFEKHGIVNGVPDIFHWDERLGYVNTGDVISQGTRGIFDAWIAGSTRSFQYNMDKLSNFLIQMSVNAGGYYRASYDGYGVVDGANLVNGTLNIQYNNPSNLFGTGWNWQPQISLSGSERYGSHGFFTGDQTVIQLGYFQKTISDGTVFTASLGMYTKTDMRTRDPGFNALAAQKYNTPATYSIQLMVQPSQKAIERMFTAPHRQPKNSDVKKN